MKLSLHSRLITILCLSSLGMLATLAKADNTLPGGTFEISCRPNPEKGKYVELSSLLKKMFRYDYNNATGVNEQTIYAFCQKLALKSDGTHDEQETQLTRQVEIQIGGQGQGGTTVRNTFKNKCLNMGNSDGNLFCE